MGEKPGAKARQDGWQQLERGKAAEWLAELGCVLQQDSARAGAPRKRAAMLGCGPQSISLTLIPATETAIFTPIFVHQAPVDPTQP